MLTKIFIFSYKLILLFILESLNRLVIKYRIR